MPLPNIYLPNWREALIYVELGMRFYVSKLWKYGIFWATLLIFSICTDNNCGIISASNWSLTTDRKGMYIYSAPQTRNFSLVFTKNSKLIKLSCGRSPVYSAKFCMNDRLISYEEDN